MSEQLKDFWMEDVGSITGMAHDVIEKELKERFRFEMTTEESNKIWDAIWKPLEDLSNGNYRHEM